MTQMITIDDSDLRDHLRKLNININKYGRRLVRRKAEILVEELHKRIPTITGELKRRTRKVPERKGWGYNIFMPDYGVHRDSGTRPSKGGQYMPMSKAMIYASKYGINNVNAWRRSIAMKGTKPHPYIRVSIMAMNRRSKAEIKKLTKKMLKK